MLAFIISFIYFDAHANGHSKIDKTMALMTNGSLMNVESIAELEHSVIPLT